MSVHKIDALLEMNKPCDWRHDPRRHGRMSQAGFRPGFERAVLDLMVMAEVREAIPFPRAPSARISSRPFRATLSLPL